MTSADCPDCGLPLSADATCEGCGRSASAEGDAGAVLQPEPCPACGAETLVPVAMAHTYGPAVLRGALHGEEAPRDAPDDGDLTRRVAPPEAKPEMQPIPASPALIFGGLAAFLLFGFRYLPLILLVGALGAGLAQVRRNRQAARWNREELPKLLAAWQQRRVCLSCGQVTEAVAEPAPA
jgi:hypothetical protein